jgi:class 3 adenylate cyclase/cellobiose-specific phosphotransferase system component IIA
MGPRGGTARYARGMGVCARCGRDDPGGSRFCGACGAPLQRTHDERIIRKTVTVLFVDMKGSTELGEALDPEAFRRVMQDYYDMARQVIERHGGTVAKFVGDAVMAVFGIPRVREDDAVRSVRTAAEIRAHLRGVGSAFGVELEVRVGINTGPVAAGSSSDALALGDAVNVAARLEQAATPGEILLGSRTLQLVRDAVTVERLDPLVLKGKATPVEAWRLLSIDPVAPGLARRFDSPLVGREAEGKILWWAYDRAKTQLRCHLVALLGEAGVGKSRVVADWLRELGEDAMVLDGRCLHYGEGITFWPIAEALRPLGARAETVLRRLEKGLVAAPQELFFDVRQLIESVARARPVVVVLDDLQWAQPMLVDLVDHILEFSRDAAILLLCLARAESYEVSSVWDDSKPNVTVMTVRPLSDVEARHLLEQLKPRGLDGASRARLISACRGNPLFLEELARSTRSGDSSSVPPSIQALLAARLEELPERELALLQRGAVEGEVFHRSALNRSGGDQRPEQTDAVLEALLRKGLIRIDGAQLSSEQTFRFHHLLVRDAAYDALAKATRVELHERFATWLEHSGRSRWELDEISGWHLEQAAAYCGELGLPERAALAARSSDQLSAAGRRASARQDFGAADNLLSRALTQAPEDRGARASVALELADVLVQAAHFARVPQLLDEAASDPSLTPYTTLVHAALLLYTDPAEGAALTRRTVPRILDQLRATGDHRGVARAHFALFEAHWLASRADPSAAELRRVIAAARRANAADLEARALMFMAGPVVFGPASPTVMRQELAKMDAADIGPLVGFGAEFVRAALSRMNGSFDEARLHCDGVRTAAAALGMPAFAAGAGQMAGDIELSAGRPAAAVAELRRTAAALDKLGEVAMRSTVLARLAYALLENEKPLQAERAAHQAEKLSAPEDVINFACTNGVLAEVFAQRGAFPRAEALAQSALSYALQTDFPSAHADAHLAMARVAAACGRRKAAAQSAGQALMACEMKGDKPLADRARTLVTTLT